MGVFDHFERSTTARSTLSSPLWTHHLNSYLAGMCHCTFPPKKLITAGSAARNWDIPARRIPGPQSWPSAPPEVGSPGSRAPPLMSPAPVSVPPTLPAPPVADPPVRLPVPKMPRNFSLRVGASGSSDAFSCAMGAPPLHHQLPHRARVT